MSEPRIPDRYVFGGVALSATTAAGWISAESVHGMRPTWEIAGAAFLVVSAIVLATVTVREAEDLGGESA